MLFRNFLVDLRHYIKIYRKDGLSPNAARRIFRKNTPTVEKRDSKKALLLTLSGSLSVEAAVVVPLFAAAMAAVLQFVNVYGDAAKTCNALTQTCEEIATGAYASEYTESDSPLPVVLSAGYAEGMVRARTGEAGCTLARSMLLSRFLEEEDRIDLVMTYRVKSPSGLVKIPWTVFVQRAAVRGWVGRKGSGSTGETNEEEEDEHQTVYITDYGTVYHTDPDCTHIHLSIRQVSSSQAAAERNVYGEKYHACEKCGGGDGLVYITSDGNRYHSSLECSGLKRSVQEIHLDEAGNLRPCSKCAGG